MASCPSPMFLACTIFLLIADVTHSADIFLEWNVAIDYSIKPVGADQPVITINGMFPGPLINATTNDVVHVNIFNNLREPLLMTWNGIQQRLNSWQDGVSGTNCPILPATNWTYVFQTKDQIGSYFYFLTTNFQKAGGGFGAFRVNNRNVIAVPFPKPESEFDLLIGDWYPFSYWMLHSLTEMQYSILSLPSHILMNGKPPYSAGVVSYESFNVSQGKTYRFRISNVGAMFSLNLRIQGHQMVLVETEGSYVNQITLDSLDVHVGQSYSVLVTCNQSIGDYYIVASPTQVDFSVPNELIGISVLHYNGSTNPPQLPLPIGPDPMDQQFSVAQAKSIRWNMTTGAARPNPQGTFNITNVTISQTFVLQGSKEKINGFDRYAVNNVSYSTPTTPLKLADHFLNGYGVYQLDAFPVNSSNPAASFGTSVVSGYHKGWMEIVFQNGNHATDSWHLDGFGFYVVGFGDGMWSMNSRAEYNLFDPVVRSTVQVYKGGWTAIYAYLDNPGMWNLRSQLLQNWWLGQELYIRVYDPDPDEAKERPPPSNLLLCGIFATPAPFPSPGPPSISISPAPQGTLPTPADPLPSSPTSSAPKGCICSLASILGVAFTLNYGMISRIRI